MRHFIFLTLPLLGALTCAAKPPLAKNVSAYSSLWLDSPFTDKPEAVVVEDNSALNDYALTAVSGVGGVWTVRLMEKKDRTNRLRLSSDSTDNGDFKIVDVKMGRTYRDTVVTLSYRGRTGKLTFSEDKLIAVAGGSPPARQPAAQTGGQKKQGGGGLPAGAIPATNNNSGNNGGAKKPGPRVVLPK